MSGDLFAIPRAVELLDRGTPVQGPEAMVFSTAPRLCNGADGKKYIVKGEGDPGVVAAEAIGYTIAGLLGVEVPDFGIVGSDETLFASKHVDECIRDPVPFFARYLPILARVILLDVLLFNDDRNVGGFVAHKHGLVALDFEKSKAVRLRYPLVELPTLNPKGVWPRGMLGDIAKGCEVPWDLVARVEQLTDAEIRSATHGVAQAVPGYTWADASGLALRARRDNFKKLVREVWP